MHRDTSMKHLPEATQGEFHFGDMQLMPGE